MKDVLLTKTQIDKIQRSIRDTENAQFYLKLVEKADKGIYEKIRQYAKTNAIPFSAALWVGINGERPVCKEASCKKYTKFNSFTKGFGVFCSYSCSRKWHTTGKFVKAERPVLAQASKTAIIRKMKSYARTPTAFAKWLDVNYPEVRSYSVVEARKQGVRYSQITYNLVHDLPKGQTCVTCGKVPTAFLSMNQGYLEHCSNYCMSTSEKIKNKRIATNLKNNGVEYPQQSKKIRRRLERNNLKKYGVSNVSSVKEFQNNRAATMLDRYGSKNAMGNEVLRHKASMNSLAGRGRLRYAYTLGRREVEVRGFEPYALAWIEENTKVKGCEIFVDTEKKVPVIRYKYRGSDKTYYPDFFIPRLNKIVEVKAPYPLLYSRDAWYIMRRKRKAVIEAGFSFSLLVMTSKGGRINFPLNWHTMRRQEVLRQLQMS